ncbi:hypothetical protein QAD02_012488 [Eretmocerus hayati]|uniref:Uncharacterized protein n=1 Tax=Eretmocerus hayati TaxID=131215 RepID=A0ACC2NZU6_9HYME|nr:hypothetical protein QAD02_012488 [Eretmocerus hayati]
MSGSVAVGGHRKRSSSAWSGKLQGQVDEEAGHGLALCYAQGAPRVPDTRPSSSPDIPDQKNQEVPRGGHQWRPRVRPAWHVTPSHRAPSVALAGQPSLRDF